MTAQERRGGPRIGSRGGGPGRRHVGSVDAAGLGSSTFAGLRRAAAKPTATTSAAMRFWTSVAMAGPVATARSMGMTRCRRSGAGEGQAVRGQDMVR